MTNHRMTTISAAAVALLALSTTSLADDVHCPPNLGSVTIDGNVLIAAPCRLNGTKVKGNVHLYAGGSLIARGDVRIDGNIQAENADFIDVEQAHINGSIQLDNLVGDLSVIDRSTVGGSIQLKSNRSRLEVLGNRVSADVQAFSNTGGVVIADNEIDGNLQCKENRPPPAGGNNRVQGNKEDQCANLHPESSTGGSETSAPESINSTAGASTDSSSSGGGGGGSMGVLSPLVLIALLLRRSRRSATA